MKHFAYFIAGVLVAKPAAVQTAQAAERANQNPAHAVLANSTESTL